MAVTTPPQVKLWEQKAWIPLGASVSRVAPRTGGRLQVYASNFSEQVGQVAAKEGDGDDD
jgi:hypothetical protein